MASRILSNCVTGLIKQKASFEIISINIGEKDVYSLPDQCDYRIWEIFFSCQEILKFL